MKKYINYSIATLLALCVGCSDFGDTNVSPNGSATPLTSALLTQALTVLYPSQTDRTVLPGLYAQYFSETLYTDASRYSVQDVNWTELSGSMYDLQNIININSDPTTAAYAALNGSNNNQIAIARILKAYRFSLLTDRYGDMPYTEALVQNTQPKYDTQQSIYNDLFKELKEAIAQFDNGPTVSGDILFAGDVTKWKKFANSWRLILALRISNVDEALGKQQFADALVSDGGVLASGADDINLTYTGNSVAFSNPWFGISGDYAVSTTVSDYVNEHSDPRKDVFGKPVGGDLVGVPPGLQRQDAIAYAANTTGISFILSDDYRKATSTLSFLTYADVLLAKAEAAERGWNSWTTTEAAAFYNDGIKASFEHWGVYTLNAYNNYMDPANNPDVTFGTTNHFEKIGTQRWLSFYPNGPQGWAEWRRTGFPKLTPAPQPVNTSGQIPIRYIYPTSEYALNGTNVTAAVQGLSKGDTQDSNVWWDK